jgi:hypothetical protein
VGAGGVLFGERSPLLEALLGAGDLAGGAALLGEDTLDLADERQPFAPAGEAAGGLLDPTADDAEGDLGKRRCGRHRQHPVEAAEELLERGHFRGVSGAPAASAVAAKR